jgi:uncharacterized protein with ParB-like and HNH nuclease domain
MVVSNLLDTSTVSLSDIIGNGKVYIVPAYQRDYSWQKDHWEDLWVDILTILNGSSIHYMGSIVLQDKGDKQYSVIDGQQRLSTLTLLVLATIKTIQNLVDKGIDKANNQERISLLSKKFLGDKDPGSLTYAAKLQLNENNNSFFQTHLMVFRPPLNEKILRDSDKLLWQAYHFFLENISNLFLNNEKGEEIANFLNKQVAEKMIFIQIVVEDELSAYTFFETLNARGVDLTVTDLLKNYLFSQSTTVDLKHVKEQWQRIVDTVGLHQFPVFLRHYWVSKKNLVRQGYLFRAIKDIVTTSSAVIELLDELEKNALLYNALSNASDPFWMGEKEQRKRVKEIALFKEKQALPLLLACYNNLPTDEFKKMLKTVSVITFRYSVIGGLNPNLKEEVYNKAAIKISHQQLSTAAQIAKELGALYVSDKEFKNSFSAIQISTRRNKKLVRYILFEIENYLAQTNTDDEDSPASIEHIVPENLNENWAIQFPKILHASAIYRLGNYTLLEEDKNRQCGNEDFNIKKNIYVTSQYQITKQIIASEWTITTLENRQTFLAKQANTIWRLPYFDDPREQM